MEGLLAAVMGDKDSHGLGGALMPMNSKISIMGNPLITAMLDKAMPDQIGMLMHPITPTDPKTGSSKVSAYGNQSALVSGLMNGKFNLRELVKIAGKPMGFIQNFTSSSPTQGQAVLQAMGGEKPQFGDVIVGQDTGATMTVYSVDIDTKYDTPAYGPDYSYVNEHGISDDAGIIASDDHFTGLPSQDYQATNALVNN
mgnify:CR=1 FL=1